MQTVFISYRRAEAEMVAGRLRESLAKRLGKDKIFRDKNSIPGGANWKEVIEARLTRNVAVLALIGPTWAVAQDGAGIRRLGDPNDWSRIELELALKCGARIIPVLIEETRMPEEFELPESLRQIASISALRLRDGDWDSDIQLLIQAIGARPGVSWVQRPALVALAAILILAGGAGYRWWQNSSSFEGPLNKVPLPQASGTFLDSETKAGNYGKVNPDAYCRNIWSTTCSFGVPDKTISNIGSQSIRVEVLKHPAGVGEPGGVVRIFPSKTPLDLSIAKSIALSVFDKQGRNTVALRLCNGDYCFNNSCRDTECWSEKQSTKDEWTTITWPMSIFEKVDKHNITAIELREFNDGVYYFNDIKWQ